jgi:hypothetical protein
MGGCRVTLTLETARRVRLGKVRAVLVLGSKRVRLRAGRHATVSIRMAAGAAGLARHHKLAVRVRVATSDAAGNHASRSVRMTLRIPGKRA